MRDYAVQASDGDGIALTLTNLVNFGTILSGVEIIRANAGGVDAPTVALEQSTDGGTTWQPIAGAGAVPIDRYGAGSFVWTAGPQAGNVLIRATASVAGVAADVSDRPFQVANAGTAYYVNDGSTAGDEFTTATGDNANDGKTPGTPMASLAALLRAYDLDAGDVIHVDTGSYALATDIRLEAQDSGVVIRGPQLAGQVALLDRGNADATVFVLAGADDVTIEHLSLTGAKTGISGETNADSDRITVRDVIITAVESGVVVAGDNDAFTIRDSDIDATITGISLNVASAAVLGNVVHGNDTGIRAVTGTNSSGSRIRIAGNDVRDNRIGIRAENYVTIEDNRVFDNDTTGISAVGNTVTSGNKVYANRDGIQAFTTSAGNPTLLDNRVFGNTGVGLDASGGRAEANRIHDNAVGLVFGSNAIVRGNLIYDNTQTGVRMGGGQTVLGAGFIGNTVYQPTGDALVTSGISGAFRIRDNIFAVGSGYAFRVGDEYQSGFVPDFNLFHLTGGGRLAQWEGRDFATLADWFYETGNDGESLVADPRFVDPDGADGVRGFEGGVDGGADDDFRIRQDSPAADRADPASIAIREPGGGGGRADLGAYGNTALATTSPDRYVQILNPNGLEKFELGQSVRVELRSAGLTPFSTVLRLDTGTVTEPVAGWLPDQYRTAGTFATTSNAISVAGVVGVGPAAMYENYLAGTGQSDNRISYRIPAADGDYTIVLHTLSRRERVGESLFSVSLQGSVVAASVDRRALAGGTDRALVLNYDVSARDGAGIALDLTNLTNSSFGSEGAVLAGIELRRISPDGVINPTVDIEASTNGGASWLPVAGGIALDRNGDGSFDWAAGPQPGSVLLRATARAGGLEFRDVSDDPFQVANAGRNYYVNDGSRTGDEFTTAVGDNANNGKTPGTPMSSLAALLRAYDLDAGDVVYVDTGIYSLASSIDIRADDSGVTIRGPSLPGHAAVLDRGNTSVGAAGIRFVDASGVTLEALTVTGAYDGIGDSSLVGSTGNTLRDLEVYGNRRSGILLGNRHSDWTIADNVVRNNTDYGVWVTGGGGLLLSGNEIYGNGSRGVFASASTSAGGIRVEDNVVRDNGQYGLYLEGAVNAQRNQVFGHDGSGDIGIYGASNAMQIADNDVFDNTTGISGDGSARLAGNRGALERHWCPRPGRRGGLAQSRLLQLHRHPRYRGGRTVRQRDLRQHQHRCRGCQHAHDRRTSHLQQHHLAGHRRRHPRHQRRQRARAQQHRFGGQRLRDQRRRRGPERLHFRLEPVRSPDGSGEDRPLGCDRTRDARRLAHGVRQPRRARQDRQPGLPRHRRRRQRARRARPGARQRQ